MELTRLISHKLKLCLSPKVSVDSLSEVLTHWSEAIVLLVRYGTSDRLYYKERDYLY